MQRSKRHSQSSRNNTPSILSSRPRWQCRAFMAFKPGHASNAWCRKTAKRTSSNGWWIEQVGIITTKCIIRGTSLNRLVRTSCMKLTVSTKILRLMIRMRGRRNSRRSRPTWKNGDSKTTIEIWRGGSSWTTRIQIRGGDWTWCKTSINLVVREWAVLLSTFLTQIMRTTIAGISLRREMICVRAGTRPVLHIWSTRVARNSTRWTGRHTKWCPEVPARCTNTENLHR